MNLASLTLLGAVSVANPAVECEGFPVFSDRIAATDKSTFSWSTPGNVDYVIGALSNLSSYALLGRASAATATSFDTSAQVPAPGAGFFYLVKPSDSCASWQSTIGAEPRRDVEIHDPCSIVNPPAEDLEAAVAAALVGLVDPWQDPSEFVTLLDRVQDRVQCAFELEPTATVAGSAARLSGQDCLLTQCPGVGYCGPRNTRDGFAAPEGLVGACLNDACFAHDKCSFLHCVYSEPECYFSTQSDEVICDDGQGLDAALFAACLGGCSPLSEGANAICTIAFALVVRPGINPSCLQPPCSDADADCEKNVCEPTSTARDPNTGCVVQGNEANGSTCDDGLLCTQDEVCTDAVCLSSCEDSNPCTNTVCDDPDNPFICENTPTSGGPCDDSNECTVFDSCLEGICSGASIPGPCDDSNACTSNDACSDGVCIGGGPLNCDDGNVCTSDTCEPSTGCVHTPNVGCGAYCLEVAGGGWVEVPDSPSLDVHGDLTIEFWAWIDPAATYFPAVSKWHDGGVDHRSYFVSARDAAGPSALRFSWSPDGGQSPYYNLLGPMVSTAEWHHVAAVRAVDQMLLYVDGILVAATTAPTVPIYDSAEPFRMGQGFLYDTVVYAIGQLDDVRVWNGACQRF